MELQSIRGGPATRPDRRQELPDAKPGVPDAPGFGALGWKPGVPGEPDFGLLGWKRAYLGRWAVLLALLVVAGGRAAPGARAEGDSIGALAHIQAPPPDHRFPDGTTYVYTAEWRIWTAGTASLRVEEAGNRQEVTAGADAVGVVALLFRVHDRFESRFDPRTFCSESVVKRTEEGLRQRDTRISFDYARGKAVLQETNLRNNEKKHAEQDIPGCVTDVLSGIYYAASLPLEVGRTYFFPLNDGGKTVNVRATVEGRELVKTEAGTFSTLRVRPEASEGVLKDRGKMWFWYSDDSQRIPVQMSARLFWGTLTIRLQRIDK